MPKGKPVSRIFLDTNILLDILIKDRPNHHYSGTLLGKLLDFDVYVSEDMLTTIYYVAKEKQKALEFLAFIQNEWHIVSFGADVMREGIAFARKHGSDLEDTLQCLCAKYNKCEAILTSDTSFVECGIRLETYETFLLLHQQTNSILERERKGKM